MNRTPSNNSNNANSSNNTEDEISNIYRCNFELISLLYQNLPYIESEDVQKAMHCIAVNDEKGLMKILRRKESAR